MREDFRNRIQSEADNVARLYLFGREIGQPATLEQKAVIESVVAADYDGRTLIELLQNGHDAHPGDRTDGALEFVLREGEGPWGVLYVANGGRPIRHEDFEAMCRVAMSSKRPDEGIGNKGVGFKSVHQLADAPEIYSRADAESETFDGYCFRFAKPGDFDDLAARVAGNMSGLAEELRENVASLKVPVPLGPAPSQVADFASRGFATVIRMELRSAEARERARQQLNEITSQGVPFHIFLQRVGTVVVTREDREGKISSTTLRKQILDSTRAGDVVVEDVLLQSSRRFVMLRQFVPEELVKDAIARSRREGRLSSGWDSWRGDAQVCVALPHDGDVVAGRLYTFLPMGEAAAAPLAGFVNAPFFARLDRRTLDLGVALNDLLLNQVALMCARVIDLACRGEIAVSATHLIDLTAWKREHLARIEDAFKQVGDDIRDAAFIPSLGRVRRTSLRDARLWSGEGRTFTAHAAASAGVDHLVDPALDGARQLRLRKLAEWLGLSIDAREEEVAAWAERYADVLTQEPLDTNAWADFYDDLSAIFNDGSVLAGRTIILADDGRLARAESRSDDLAVFFSPQQRADSWSPALVPKMPAAITSRLVFAHRAVPWRGDDPARKRRPGRAWLEEHGLVREFRTETVLDLVGAAMRALPASESEQLRELLMFAFAVWRRASREVTADAVAGARLLVPAGDTWMPAEQAHFGPGWNGPARDLDDLLARFLRRAADHSPALKELAERTLNRPKTLHLDDPDGVERLRLFLEHAGVRHGLTPVFLPRQHFILPGSQLALPRTAPNLPISVPTEQQKAWRGVAERWPNHQPVFTSVRYQPADHVAVLPAQDDYHCFDSEARRMFAELILHGLDRWPDHAMEIEFRRQQETAATWPSFLAAFLATADWLPQTTPGQRDDITFLPVSNSWWIRTAETPSYLRAQPGHLRSLATGKVLDRLRKIGVRFWDDSSTARDRLVELTALVGARPLDARSQTSLSVRKAYEAAWSDLVSASTQENPLPHDVIAHRSGTLFVALLGDGAETVYVPDRAGVVQERLLRQAPIPVLALRDINLSENVYHLLDTTGAGNLRRTSDARVDITVDGQSPHDKHRRPLLAATGQWVTTVVLAAMEFHHAMPTVSDAQLTRAAQRLAAATLTTATDLDTTVDGHQVTDLRPFRSFLLEGDIPQLIVAGAADTSAWSVLQAASSAICELVGAPHLVETLRLAFIDLQQRCSGAIDPSLDDIAAVLGVSTQELNALTDHHTSWRARIPRLVPVLALVDARAAEQLQGVADTLDSLDDLRNWLTDQLTNTPHTPAKLLMMADESDVRGAARELGVDHASMNAALAALGLPRLHNHEGHARQLAAYLQQHASDIHRRIRDAFLHAYQAGEPLQRYVELLGLAGLEPEAAWLDQHWDLPDSLLGEHVELWLQQTVPHPTTRTELPAVEQMRESNRRQLGRILNELAQLTDAWMRHTGIGQEHTPADPAAVSDAMTAAGVLDFERMSTDTVIGWLRAHEQWPAAMPPTAALTDLGLTRQDLLDARQRLHQTATRDHRPVHVTLDDREYSLAPSDLMTFVDAVRDGMTEQLLNTPASPIAATPLDLTRPSARGTGIARWTATTDAVRPEVTRNIGLAGEIIAGQWLQHQFGVPPHDSWVSGNRNQVLGDGQGNDALGYDFHINASDRTLLFEVKATTGDQPQFVLGESEVRRAQNLAPGEEYVIVFISHVLDSGRRRIIPLPNPMGAGGLGYYRVVGSSLRLQFTLEAAPVAPFQADPAATS
ncbi:DUF3883 domain-containing protein [Catellatospora sp. KI3]|uniref:sacsin N-terminal ATP-binding-like domain-containing protein n=1 Tax=Catellatospora sp. KI3 TaxID=3041620 RepID=UPI002482A8CC|nr:DUF3883 domain-containing protein [Catellatospora sp. KI3]MDI1463380.1 DUF3883 domain-containing protein [Catellatospora sp. KI3]